MANRTEPIDFVTGLAGVALEIGADITNATEGSVLFAGVGGILQQNNARFFWDDGNRLLGLGTNSPTDSLDIAQVGNSGLIRVRAFSENSVVFVGADGVLSQDTTGLTFRPSLNQFGIGIASPSQNLSILETNTLRSATMRLQQSASSGIGSVSFSMIGHSGSSGNVFILQQETGGESWAFGIDNDQGDRWTISNAGSVGLSNRLFIDSSKIQVQLEDAANTVVDLVLRLTHALTGASSPAVAGMGVGMEFEAEVRSNQFRVGAIIEAITTDVGAGAEKFDLVFKTMLNGAAAAERLRITSAGNILLTDLEIDGDLNHDGANVGFYGTPPIVLQTGVAVSAVGVHAALVNLGLITA